MADDIRLYLFEGGTVHLPEKNHILGGGENFITTPITWSVLVHPRGNVIIDGGNAPEVAVDARRHWGRILDISRVVMTPDQAVLPGLERIGVDPESIRWVVQSHLHNDHTGAVAVIDRLPNAQVLATRTEFTWAQAPEGFVAMGYCPADYVKDGIDWFLLEDGDDGFDLFGDGVLTCWFTPGHTPGHMSLLVRMPSERAYLLTVDAANTIDHLEERLIPGFNLMPKEAGRSLKRLRYLAWREQATVIPGHDPDLWPTLKQAPEFYD
ncbi:N-acyl homoserine lactonase family protein [Conexibacter sp. CPCC 206217]|uniref:N-acyl homoserine lactonase family protein n=1 Tax=Conexibacter sp. CPCC 206217 TaxID=3064574 RepID=UPI00271EED90|nr:N-acyl homoserine lactonase family protein [Conexibacter sp. CPCC 206217]MDO8211147.1 N-acyl homoserine lactonase family protein [Conexibacter sp. CPCC 206217]